MIGIVAAIAALAATFGTCRVQAGTGQWTTNGPYGGLVTVLAVDPQTPNNMYAAGFSGVFKSADGGVNWARASNGITDPTVDALVIDPVTPTTLYAGTIQGGKVVKSTDGAQTWTPVGPTLVVALAIDPKTPATLYASREQAGISKSIDGGATWAPIGMATLPTGFPTFTSLVVDPKTPATVYAGAKTQGVFKSVDGGATWAAVNTGFTGPIIQIYRLAIDPQAPSTLYAAASTSGGDGLFKSTDGGASWTKILASGAAHSYYIGTVTVDPQTPSTIYIGTANGAFKSTNGGTSFTPIRTGMPTLTVSVLAINPQNPATVYAGTQNGVFATTNAGAGWTTSSNGLALTTVTAVAVDPLTPTTIYAGTSVSGMFRSVDGGTTWTAINGGIPPTGNLGVNFPGITSLAIDPLVPNTLYAGTQNTQNSMVLKSINGGASWANATSGIPDYFGVSAVAIDPQATSTVYAGMVTSGVYKSTDSGVHWSAATGIPADAHVTGLSIAVIPPDASSLGVPSEVADSVGIRSLAIKSAGGTSGMAASTNGSGLYYSTDGGKTGAQLGSTAGDGFFCSKHQLAVLIQARKTGESNADLFKICVTNGVTVINGNTVMFNGTTYKLSSKPFPPGATAPANAASNSGVVVKSVVEETVWGPPDGSSAEAVACSPVTSIVGNPLDDVGFYAGAACGVLKGTNLGQQLVTMSAGLPPNLQVNAMATTPSGSDLYAGAQSGGVYRYALASVPVAPTAVIEFYNAGFDHYFISINPQEISDLDSGVHKGWARTSLYFKAYAAASGNANPVCRFYIPPQHGDSHFFSANPDECSSVLQKTMTDPNYGGYDFEAPNVFYVGLPDIATGACPAGTTPVFRLWNQRADSNHRYTTDANVRAQMLAKGYVSEGYGPLGTAMCAAN